MRKQKKIVTIHDHNKLTRLDNLFLFFFPSFSSRPNIHWVLINHKSD